MKKNERKSCIKCGYKGACHPTHYHSSSTSTVLFREDKGYEFNALSWCDNFIKKEERKMPSVSKKQRKAMAIAEHNPSKLYKKNADLKKMSKQQLHEFAETPESDLPEKTKPKKKKKGKK